MLPLHTQQAVSLYRHSTYFVYDYLHEDRLVVEAIRKLNFSRFSTVKTFQQRQKNPTNTVQGVRDYIMPKTLLLSLQYETDSINSKYCYSLVITKLIRIIMNIVWTTNAISPLLRVSHIVKIYYRAYNTFWRAK